MIKRIGGVCLASAILLMTVLGTCVKIYADAMVISESVSGDSVENVENVESVENIEENSATETENTKTETESTATDNKALTEENVPATRVVENTEEGTTNSTEGINENSFVNPGVSLAIAAPSAILMEASTGTVIYEQDADIALRPASITKIMTLILIFDALEQGKIHLTDPVCTSEYAASMGGSQVFLEPGEEQDVETMIKCIAIASANDACVAMAEYICGSEAEFVNRMNQRASNLGMTNTHFVNCNGLDADGHLTSARDVALMSRELITKYPQVEDYSTIWMENILHKTARGESEFGLTNTNKLIRQYSYATGLKTGSTSLAKYCVSATARQNDIELIAVIMQAPDYKVRFNDAMTLLSHGFAVCRLYKDENKEELPSMQIKGGLENTAELAYEGEFRYLAFKGEDVNAIEKQVVLAESVNAPVTAGHAAGEAIYYLNGAKIGSVPILYVSSVDKAGFKDYLRKSAAQWLL